jgi:putative CocE/NonD family hydrolase
MKKRISLISSLFLVLLFSQNAFSQDKAASSTGTRKISTFGQYEGYSKEIYSGWKRLSQYIPVRDGTLLAADIYRPTKNDRIEDKPLPLIWTHERYHRARLHKGKLVTVVDAGRMLTLLKNGYIIAAVDIRGSGASFGSQNIPFSRVEAQDAYDITEWFAAQSWCDKNIGMFGGSYNGTAQLFAAGTAPPHLKAIVPQAALIDIYSFLYPGGILRMDFCQKWGEFMHLLDNVIPPPGVDGAASQELLQKALEEHKMNRNIGKVISSLPFRNSLDSATDQPLHLTLNPLGLVNAINKSGVAIYHIGGWFDVFTRDSLLAYENLDVPKKITIGPWYHASSKGKTMEIEYLRWFDYWLKGIDNGIMEESPVHYFTMGAPQGKEWRSVDHWPLADSVQTAFYFRPGPSGSSRSVNDGMLSVGKPKDSDESDLYTVDYSTTSGKPSRWTNGYDGNKGMKPPLLTDNDQKGLTYTTRSWTKIGKLRDIPLSAFGYRPPPGTLIFSLFWKT